MKSFGQEKQITESRQAKEEKEDCLLPNNELVGKYRSFFTEQLISRCEKQRNLNDLASLLQSHGIRFDAQQVSRDMEVTVVRESINSEVVVLSVRWGRFTLEVFILNVAKESQIHRGKPMVGSYGHVYQASMLGKSFVIKCIDFKRFRCPQSAVMMAVKEFAILKVAAALKIGPAIKNLIGFDLVIHYDCVQFAIQKCEQINGLNESSKKNLMENLYILHSLGVVHFDIKPSNIMFSRAFGKQVFIDFGLSQLLGIKIGQKMPMNFRGSLDFCSKEMEEIFYSNRMGLIDIYNNDVQCLKSTFQWHYKSTEKCNS